MDRRCNSCERPDEQLVIFVKEHRDMETKKRQAQEWLDDLEKACGEMHGEIADIDIELKRLESRRKDLLRHIYITEKRIERAMIDVAKFDEHT